MLEIELSTKRVSWIFNISKIKKTAATGSLYIERPSYIALPLMRFNMDLAHRRRPQKLWIYFKSQN